MRVLEPPNGTFAPATGGASDFVPTPSESFPLVRVQWMDAWYDPGEQVADDWRPDYQIQTVGYLVRDDPQVVSIAQEVLPDGEGFRAVTHIPRGMVRQVDRLAVVVTEDGTALPA